MTVENPIFRKVIDGDEVYYFRTDQVLYLLPYSGTQDDLKTYVQFSNGKYVNLRLTPDQVALCLGIDQRGRN